MYVKIIKNGCVICSGDVSGNSKYRYLCIKCNISYKYNDLISKEISEIRTDNPKLNWKYKESIKNKD